MRLKLAYQDFMDAYKGGYGTHTEKYIKYSVILFYDNNTIRKSFILLFNLNIFVNQTFCTFFPKSRTFNKVYIKYKQAWLDYYLRNSSSL